MTRRARILIGFLATSLAAAPGHAQQGNGNGGNGGNGNGGNRCELRALAVRGGNVTGSYNPLEAQAAEVPFAITVTSEGCSRNAVPLKIEADASNPRAVSGSAIRLTSGPNVLEGVLSSTGRANSGNAALVADVSDGTADTNLYFLVPAGQQVPPGTYRARLKASVLPNGGSGNGSRSADAAFDIAITVAPVIGLAAGGGMVLDLGELVAGDRAVTPAQFRAYANVAYSLSFTTDYGYRLRLNSQQADPNIPYAVIFDNQHRLTSNGASVGLGRPGSTGFTQHSMNVEVPQLPLRPAGTYRDFITVEIRATVSGS